ncbi:MAG: metalloregulator ArsR/SmtB family transcription factor [Pseudomonadota bacterium]
MVEYHYSDETSLDSTFSALADPTRRAIMTALSNGERSVGELAEPFDMSLNAVSKHIKKLEAAGLVRRHRVGREHFLSVAPHSLESAALWLERRRRFWNKKLDKLEAVLREETRDD